MAKPVAFLQETYAELKKVVWPSRQEVLRLTLIVIFISIIMGLYIGGLDWVFAKGIELVIR